LILLTAALGLAAAVPTAPPAGSVGKPLPVVELEGFSKTEAESLDDYFGRAILFEFFAYW
jgi:hypothetical protein